VRSACFKDSLLLKISWTEKKSNEEVFQEAGVYPTLLKRIRQRQLAFLGHVLRRQSLENLVVTGRIDWRRARGRQRLKYLDSLCDSLKDKVSPTHLIRASEDSGSAWSPTSSTTARQHDMTLSVHVDHGGSWMYVYVCVYVCIREAK